MYKIESHIPIPDKLHSGGPKKKYPFDKMKVGDSFIVECSKELSKKVSASLKNATRRLHGPQFITKYVEEKEAFGVRIWRIQ